MTIHHDKLAYGKIAGTKEELTDEQILKMLATLQEDNEQNDNAEEKQTDNKQ